MQIFVIYVDLYKIRILICLKLFFFLNYNKIVKMEFRYKGLEIMDIGVCYVFIGLGSYRVFVWIFK